MTKKRKYVWIAVTVVPTLLSIFLVYRFQGKIENLSVAIGHIWMASSFLVSLLITGRCFSTIINELKNVDDKSKYKKNVEFWKKFCRGTEWAKWNNIIMVCIVVLYVVFIGGMFFIYDEMMKFDIISKYSLLISSSISMAVALLIFIGDYNLPALDEKLAKSFDLPVFISICVVFIFALILSFHLKLEDTYANMFATGAIAFQIVIANFTFDTEVYKLDYMFKHFKK